MVTSLIQPVMFLFVLGTGLSSLISTGSGGIDLRTFIFPGVLFPLSSLPTWLAAQFRRAE